MSRLDWSPKAFGVARLRRAATITSLYAGGGGQGTASSTGRSPSAGVVKVSGTGETTRIPECIKGGACRLFTLQLKAAKLTIARRRTLCRICAQPYAFQSQVEKVESAIAS